MSIDFNTLDKIAKMAHIDLKDSYESTHAKLISTQENIAVLRSIDTTDTELFTHQHFADQRLRSDESNFDSQRAILAKLSANFHEDSYQVPQVLATSGE